MFSQPLSIIAYLSKLVCLAWNAEANIFQFAETFIAQKFRFESRPTASSVTEDTTVSRTYSVPEADTSDEEEESEAFGVPSHNARSFHIFVEVILTRLIFIVATY